MTTIPLTLAVSLAYQEGSSDKVYQALHVNQHIIIRYGRRTAAVNVVVHAHDTQAKAAAHFWRLLRDKAGKGYRVADAETRPLTMTDPADFLARLDAATGNYQTEALLLPLLDAWMSDARAHQRNGTAANQPQPDPWTCQRTARTPKEGQTILTALADPDCDEDTLMACAMASTEERFLWPLAITHPNCPDHAKVARALLSMSA